AAERIVVQENAARAFETYAVKEGGIVVEKAKGERALRGIRREGISVDLAAAFQLQPAVVHHDIAAAAAVQQAYFFKLVEAPPFYRLILHPAFGRGQKGMAGRAQLG